MSSEVCRITDCENERVARGWCDKHYRRWIHHGDPTFTKYEKHGKRLSAEYPIWFDMKRRCYDKRNKSWINYGGRGIEVCAAWRESFSCFLRDVGVRPSAEHTLERIDNNRNYEPCNVRWATRKEQNRNTRATFRVNFRGQQISLAEACELVGQNYEMVRRRIKYGNWSVEKALETPKTIGKKHLTI